MPNDNIVALPGLANCAVPAVPDQTVVALLESYLEMAKSGEISGVAVAATLVVRQAGCRTEWAGTHASALDFLAACRCLQVRIDAAWLETL